MREREGGRECRDGGREGGRGRDIWQKAPRGTEITYQLVKFEKCCTHSEFPFLDPRFSWIKLLIERCFDHHVTW